MAREVEVGVMRMAPGIVAFGMPFGMPSGKIMPFWWEWV